MDDSPSIVPIASAASEGKFSLFMSRVRNGIIRIRRGGVPHEETVIIPAITIYVTSRISPQSEWLFSAAIILMVIVSLLCGAWLGLAWRGFPVFRVLLRTIYIGILTILLYMLFHDEPITKRDAVQTVGLMVSTVGLIFYFGYVYAAITRDVVLRRFSSENQRRRYLARMSWWKYIWGLVRKREDETQASNWDFAVSRVIASSLDIRVIPAIFLIVGLVYQLHSFFR